MRVLGRPIALLARREWVYVLSLLVPLVAYELALKVLGLLSEYPASGVWEMLRLSRSELLFGAGYTLVWIGLFAASRGMVRRIVLVFFHASAVLVVVAATAAYQYFRSTGTTLDYGFVAYYLAKPGEAQGAVSSAAPLGAWLILSAALLYALIGPMLITRGLMRTRSPDAETSGGGQPQGRQLTRSEFLVAGAGAGAGVVLLKKRGCRHILLASAGLQPGRERDRAVGVAGRCGESQSPPPPRARSPQAHPAHPATPRGPDPP